VPLEGKKPNGMVGREAEGWRGLGGRRRSTPQSRIDTVNAMPRISVVMSVYNGEAFLDAAVRSILSQTFGDFEFIVIDDGSTDRSAEIVSGYKDPRILLVRQENRGVAAALNRGLELAKEEYVARQDADDISHPERFARQVRFLDAHPEIAVLGTGSLLIDPQGRPFSSFRTFTRHERLVAELLRGSCPLMHGSVMARREALLAVGGYKPIFSHAQDVELWLRMSAQYRLGNLRDILYQQRKHDNSITQRAQIDLKIRAFARAGKLSVNTSAEEWVRFLEDFDRNFEGTWRERAFKAENLMRDAQKVLAQGQAWRAVRCLAGAFWLSPALATDLPGRVLRRLWRRFLPMAG
jgi:glycosyltransferase involved in cell wall biosynthesis